MKNCAAITSSQDRVVVQPGARNQPAVDLMDAKDRAFQITISDCHSITPSLAQLLEKTGNSNISLYFVVPPPQFNGFNIHQKTLIEWQDAGVQCFVLEWKHC